jgi:predicted TIM-barrel fold metal-dependent hydrolase
MIIDFHTHVMPPEMAAAPVWRGKCPMTIENVLDAAKEGGVDRTVISNPAHELRHMDAGQQLKTVRMINEYLASLAHKHDNIYALATTVPYGGEPFLKELERAVEQDGAKGVIILSSLPGHYPDDDDALPFFRLATELDIPVFMHPPSVGFGEERLRASAARWTARSRSRD